LETVWDGWQRYYCWTDTRHPGTRLMIHYWELGITLGFSLETMTQLLRMTYHATTCFLLGFRPAAQPMGYDRVALNFRQKLAETNPITDRWSHQSHLCHLMMPEGTVRDEGTVSKRGQCDHGVYDPVPWYEQHNRVNRWERQLPWTLGPERGQEQVEMITLYREMLSHAENAWKAGMDRWAKTANIHSRREATGTELDWSVTSPT